MFSLIVMSQIPELLKELPKTVSASCERRCFAGIIAFWLLPMQLGTGNGHGRFIQDDVVVSEWWFQGIRFDRGTSFARKTPSRFNGILQFRKENFRNTGFVFFLSFVLVGLDLSGFFVLDFISLATLAQKNAAVNQGKFNLYSCRLLAV